MNTSNSLRRTALQRAGYDVYRFAGTELFLGMKKVAEEIFTTALMYRFGGGREA
jgi:very-short-patch-repair endonuclease